MSNSQQMWRDRFFGRELSGNLMYGHYHILRNYTNSKLPYRIPGRLQHGWSSDCGISGDLSKHGEKEKAARYFVWNRRNLETSAEYGYKNVTAIGAPFLYLPPAIPSEANASTSKSLILFPIPASESEPFVDPLKTYKKYLKEIEELLSLFEPVTVCLYWPQYENKEIVQLLKDKRIPVVTLGHRDNNPYFLMNFQRLVEKYAYVSSNIFGTSAIYYSLYMRKKVFIYGSTNFAEEINHIRWETRKLTNHDEFSKLYPELLWENFDDKSHYWIGEKELGLEFKKTPSELREIFGWTPQNFTRDTLFRLLRSPALLATGIKQRWKK